MTEAELQREGASNGGADQGIPVTEEHLFGGAAEAGVFSAETRLRTQDVTLHRRLRASRLLELFQEASIAHTEQLGWPRQTTLDRGFLWMIALMRVDVTRMPEYDELVRVDSWPGKTMHVLYPRQYRLVGAGGEVLARGSALWTLVDMHTRRMADPDDHGVVIEGVTVGEELALPRPVRSEECACERQFRVPFSLCDLNGHMNNTRYLDVIDDCLLGPAQGRQYASLDIEYSAEMRHGADVLLCWREDADGAYFEGILGGERAFRVRARYL